MSDPNFILPNGESFNQMKERIINFVNNINKSDTILIVTHEGCLRAIISNFNNKVFYSDECNSKPDEIRVLDIKNKTIRLLKNR